MDVMCYVFNRDPISQAGRRRFEPGLPLFESITCGYLFFVDTPILPLSDGSVGNSGLSEIYLRLSTKDSSERGIVFFVTASLIALHVNPCGWAGKSLS